MMDVVEQTSKHNGPNPGDPCDILTIGQYLQPTRNHPPIDRWVTPETFEMYHEEGLKRGLKVVESGPMVRSSYHADHRADILSTIEAERKRGRGSKLSRMDAYTLHCIKPGSKVNLRRSIHPDARFVGARRAGAGGYRRAACTEHRGDAAAPVPAGGRGEAVASDRAAGHGLLGQGRHDATCARATQPAGRVWSFKKPTDEEPAHDYLWRAQGRAATGHDRRSTARTTRTLVVRVLNPSPRASGVCGTTRSTTSSDC